MQYSQETEVRSLGKEDALEKEMANRSSILAWKSPMDRGAWRGTIHRVGHDLATKEQQQKQTSNILIKTIPYESRNCLSPLDAFSYFTFSAILKGK